ncbi:FAD-dependent oxidoreductase [Anaerosalibacter bizertensis]|uniref:dihydrouracil dehydrogenase (NAD(+)) n=1 Tax=Anaerosalibacter bizertensis TaxID=932217 RepID=A0A9Q4ADH1_9FIRM|nr:FAD-dependent oxidoreductase [Anaerosalibacter bizertensis]MBV1819179.1 FAD-dependent oxidoreductase [Bacteroidales bacterium MSK.15.36]MCB5559936.1 FAD-dependent oxidoreductase [Anaerosalibacter bizertensis]MCG4565475.1 FAD-dependent oxidoreductase [Anaerosalibacter bizertensis]MCG4582838.1 FAD-dependent oxidoreductase [Anaerosalibacter bizertensis]MCG4583892.1 FAD-dependent oxidoreductase [Anaerosalibacter bizertensis]
MTKTMDLEYGKPIGKKFNIRTAMEEASRCLLCHDAPCSNACPAGTDPGKFIRSLRFRNIKGAAETIRENNILGGSCSLICPHSKLCEEACSRTGIDKPIKIGALQAFLIEQEKTLGMKILKAPKEKKDGKIACIGSGPASLACAAKLALEGYNVTIFEAEEKPGGVLTYGINPSRLPQEVVEHDIEIVKELGVEFVMNKRIDGKEGIKELKRQFDAIHVGVGLGKSKVIGNKNINGVVNALDFLKDVKENDGKIDVEDHVIIIGGGDVAMDCAITAKQVGAKDVCIVYRRTIEEAPANIEELRLVQRMGIPIITQFAPEKINEENNRLIGVRFKSKDGYSELNLKADKLIFAIGQEPAQDYKDFKVSDGVFASGDLINGGETVVQAVAEGKEVALEIIEYLSKKEVK